MAAQAGKTDAQILEEVEEEAKEEEAMKKAPAMAQRLICLNLRGLAPGMLPSSIGCAVFCDMRGGVESANEQYCDPCLARREEEAARERASLATVPARFSNQPSAHKQPLSTSASEPPRPPVVLSTASAAVISRSKNGGGGFGSGETLAASQARVSAAANSDEQRLLREEMAAPKAPRRPTSAAAQTTGAKKAIAGLGLKGGVKKR